MSFYALLRDVDTFGQTFLMLFKGMFGEVEFLDEFRGNEYSEYEEVATALFIVYLVVIAINFLNLLIAVLSTSHAKVQEKAEQEPKYLLDLSLHADGPCKGIQTESRVRCILELCWGFGRLILYMREVRFLLCFFCGARKIQLAFPPIIRSTCPQDVLCASLESNAC